jgi:hypothetical protein
MPNEQRFLGGGKYNWYRKKCEQRTNSMQEDKKMAGTGVMNEVDEELKKRCNA